MTMTNILHRCKNLHIEEDIQHVVFCIYRSNGKWYLQFIRAGITISECCITHCPWCGSRLESRFEY